MWLSRLLRYLKLERVTQISFSEYNSKRNFVERAHAAENEVLSRTVFNYSKAVHEKAKIGTDEHKQNMEKMAEEVKGCLEQAVFNGRHLEVHRGVASTIIFEDDDKMKDFLLLSEERKLECEWSYGITRNDITETLTRVWGLDPNFKGKYKDDYLICNNKSASESRTVWKDKYQTTILKPDDNDEPESKSNKNIEPVIQPIPDYVRFLKTGEKHYLSMERNCRITVNTEGRWKDMPDLFLPSRLLDLFYRINCQPPEYVFKEIGLLAWIPEYEVSRYFRENADQDMQSFQHDKARDKWKLTDLYKRNSCQKLQEMCRKAGLSTKGLKYQLVERLLEASTELPPSPGPSYNGNIQSIPTSLNEIKKLSTAYMKEILHYHGLSINGNRDELTLRITLMKDGHFNLAFYKEEEEILKTIDDAEKLILEERQDYLTNPRNVFRTRTHGEANKYVKGTPISHIQFDLKNFHKMLEKLREYISIQQQQNREKGKIFKSNDGQDIDSMQIHATATADDDETIFSIGPRSK